MVIAVIVTTKKKPQGQTPLQPCFLAAILDFDLALVAGYIKHHNSSTIGVIYMFLMSISIDFVPRKTLKAEKIMFSHYMPSKSKMAANMATEITHIIFKLP